MKTYEMAQTKEVNELIKKFTSWDEFFWFVPPWDAKEDIQGLYLQSFYNFLAFRTNIHDFSLGEVNDFVDYLQSTRIQDYKFLTNLTNPYNPKEPSQNWFNEKVRDISKTLHTTLNLKILKGTAHAQKSEFGQSLLIFRPYDFAVFEREKQK